VPTQQAGSAPNCRSHTAEAAPGSPRANPGLYNRLPMYLVSRIRVSSEIGSLALLTKLRWIAIASQFVVIAAVRSFLDRRLPLVLLLSVVAAAGISNSMLGLYGPQSSHPRYWLNTILLLDVLLLTALLSLSGGASNPFSVLYTLHVALAAMLAGPALTGVVILLSVLGFGSLFFVNIPLPHELGGHMHAGGAFSVHLQGMWLAFVATSVTIGFFVNRVVALLRKERDEHNRTVRLLGLATLAAGAAHEIGNPLGTIKIAASEMQTSLRDMGAPQESIDDTELILSEVDRAQRAVQQMALGAGELLGELPASMKLGDVISRLDSQYPLDIRRIELSCEHPEVQVRWPTQAVLHAVSQVLRNAIQASPASEVVTCRVQANESQILFQVADAGPGIPEDIRDRLGEPFFTTREPGQGMGLGLFIARSLVEHVGGALSIDSAPGCGTKVEIALPIGAQA
jgi:two-component system, sensor histidine kinase RegB